MGAERQKAHAAAAALKEQLQRGEIDPLQVT